MAKILPMLAYTMFYLDAGVVGLSFGLNAEVSTAVLPSIPVGICP